jgi:hypothetical protein
VEFPRTLFSRRRAEAKDLFTIFANDTAEDAPVLTIVGVDEHIGKSIPAVGKGKVTKGNLAPLLNKSGEVSLLAHKTWNYQEIKENDDNRCLGIIWEIDLQGIDEVLTFEVYLIHL